MNRFLCRLLLALASISTAVPQQQDLGEPSTPKKAAPANDIFSGTIAELTAETITVVRKVPAREGDTHRFLLDSQTKIEGRLRLKARVTVRYHADDEGQLKALHIIVR